MAASIVNVEPLTASLNGTIGAATDVVGPFDCSLMALLCFSFSGTYAGVTANFEGSLDGTVWFPVAAGRVDTSSIGTSQGLSANQSIAFEVAVGAFRFFRVRASAWTSGVCNVSIAGTSLPYDPAASVQISGTVPTAPQPGSSTYQLAHRLISLATTNLTSVKNSSTIVGALVLANLTAAVKFVKLYNKSSAPVPASDTPVFTIPIPPNQTIDIALGDGFGYRFTNGFAYSITGALADTDTTAVAAGDVVVNASYS